MPRLLQNLKKGMFKMKLTPMKAIRKKCLDCCCGQIVDVRLCTIKDCPLHCYRMGHRPKQSDTEQE